MVDVVKEARRLHKSGYDLIPLNGKRPIQNNWVEAPRLGLEELEQKLAAGRNVGIRLGQPMPDGRYIACLDVDVNGELNSEENKQIDELLNSVTTLAPKVPCASTGSGRNSRHVYVATEQPAKTHILGKASRTVEYQKAGKTKTGPAWTVELRGLGAQVVLPPSVHPDTQATYAWRRGHRLNGAGHVPSMSPTQLQQKGSPQQLLTTVKPRLDELPIAPLYRTMLETGDHADYPSRSEALYAVLCVLVRDTKLTDNQIDSLVLSYPLGDKAQDKPKGWVAKQCAKLRLQKTDPVSKLTRLIEDKSAGGAVLDEVTEVFKEASKAGLSAAEREEIINLAKKATGISKVALREELDSFAEHGAAQQARLATGDPVYEEVLARHMLVSWAGKPAVFRERDNPPAWESRYDIMTVGSLATFYENKPILMGKKLANPVDIWRGDINRAEFLEGARLVPPEESCPEGVFNLWQGFAVDPVKADVSLWRKFLLEVICGGHQGYADWLEDWIADMFQNIGTPQGVAIVLRGAEGIGKGTFANVLGHIMGGHYRHVTQESQLTGRFNAHFADSTLIFADELIWGGDKKHKGALYAIVTEKYMMVERKNFDAVPMRNFNRMIVASNNNWVVPTGLDGRRWFVLDVVNKYKSDSAFFAKLRNWLSKGGYEGILDYYLTRKITSNLRKAPVTKGLMDQKMAGADSVTAWWVGVLERGSITEHGEWKDSLLKLQVTTSYHTFCKTHGKVPEYDAVLFRELYGLVPGARSYRARVDSGSGERAQFVEFPELEDCRKALVQVMGEVEGS